MQSQPQAVLSVKNLAVSFASNQGRLNALTGVDLEVSRGQTIAIVGESGSGKSVTAKAITGLLPSSAKVDSGEAIFTYSDPSGNQASVDLLSLDKAAMRRRFNGRHLAMVFQDPMTSLDPTMNIGNQLMEGMVHVGGMNKADAKKRALSLLAQVEIADPAKRMKNYPHQLSGGMRQRVVIAIALSNNPDLLICDEPTTALDVTIQAKILKLIKGIQAQTGFSVIYITHDLGVVANVADSVFVMYAGRIVEKGSAEEVFIDPRHPYTWGLLLAVPSVDMAQGELYNIPGSPPSLLAMPKGDPFAPRNPYALNIDYRLPAPMFHVSGGHYAATWLLHEKAPKVQMPEELARRIAKMKRETPSPGDGE